MKARGERALEVVGEEEGEEGLVVTAGSSSALETRSSVASRLVNQQATSCLGSLSLPPGEMGIKQHQRIANVILCQIPRHESNLAR